MKRIVQAVLLLVIAVTVFLLLEPEKTVLIPLDESAKTAPHSKAAAVSSTTESTIKAKELSPVGGSEEASGPTRGPARTGTIILGERIDRFVPHFEGGPGDPVTFDVDLLGESIPVALVEFERVPGSAGSGVFFGFVEGEPHSRVSWAFHGEAEVGEIQIHGQDTLKILPVGVAREHRVQAWDPLELKRCAHCLAQEL